MTATCRLPNARRLHPEQDDEFPKAALAFEACNECGRTYASLLNAGAAQWSWYRPEDPEAHRICEDCLDRIGDNLP